MRPSTLGFSTSPGGTRASRSCTNVTLHSLFLGYYLRHLRQPDLYIARMAECYGIEGLRSAHRILGPGLDGVALRVEDDDLFRYTFTEEALHSATGAVVHSHWHAEIVRRLWAGPVCEAWLPAQPAGRSTAGAGTRNGAPGNGRDGRVTLLMLGPVHPASHIADVVDVLAEDSELAAHACLLIVGRSEANDPYVRALERTIADHGLSESVRMLGHLPPDEVDRCMVRTDVFVNLRHRDIEGCSSSLMRQLLLGRPVVAYDTGSFSDVPSDAIVKVALHDQSDLGRRLRDLVHSAERRRTIGSRGRAFAQDKDVTSYAETVLRFAERTLSRESSDRTEGEILREEAERVAANVGETLASLGAGPSSPGVETVVGEAIELLAPPA